MCELPMLISAWRIFPSGPTARDFSSAPNARLYQVDRFRRVVECERGSDSVQSFRYCSLRLRHLSLLRVGGVVTSSRRVARRPFESGCHRLPERAPCAPRVRESRHLTGHCQIAPALDCRSRRHAGAAASADVMTGWILEFDDVFPRANPLVEQRAIVALHDLVTAGEIRRYPTVDVSQTGPARVGRVCRNRSYTSLGSPSR